MQVNTQRTRPPFSHSHSHSWCVTPSHPPTAVQMLLLVVVIIMVIINIVKINHSVITKKESITNNETLFSIRYPFCASVSTLCCPLLFTQAPCSTLSPSASPCWWQPADTRASGRRLLLVKYRLDWTLNSEAEEGHPKQSEPVRTSSNELIQP